MITRRQLLIQSAALVASPGVLSAQTATPDTRLPGVVTIHSGESLWGDVVLDHYRVIDLSADLPGTSCVIGSMINTGSNHVEVPFGIDIVIRDAEEIIIGAELLIPDYPILPPNTPMGFTSLPLRESFSEVDPTTVSIDVESALAMESGAKDRLDAKSIEIVSAVDVSTGDGSLQIEITLKNTSDSDFENGFDPRVSVWDDEGLYCGNAFANMFSRLPAGDTVRFTTQSQGSIPNPLDLAGDDYTWKVWIAPR